MNELTAGPVPLGTIQPPEEPKMLFDDWLPPGSLNIFYSRAGIGKTGFLVELVKAMKTGSRIGPQQAFRKYDGSILWCNGELPQNLMYRTTRPIAELPHVYVWDLLQTDLWAGDNFDIWGEIAAQYGVVVLDTRSSLFDQDMNDADSTKKLFLSLRNLCNEGVTILLAAHAAKPNATGVAQSGFGSSAQEWFADNIIALRPPTQREWSNDSGVMKDEYAGEMQLEKRQCFFVEHEKAKWSAPFSRLCCAWVSDGEGGRYLKSVAD